MREAVADAKQVRKLAFAAAKQKIVEEMAPSIKNLVERQISNSIEQEDVDRLRRAADGYGETEFEEGTRLEGDKSMDKEKDKDLEEQGALGLETMFPGIAEMGFEDDEEGDMKGMSYEMGMPDEEEGMPREMGMEGMPREMGMQGMRGDEEDDEMEYAGSRPGQAIPTLGEKKGEDEEEDDMDEEITIDEEGLKRAYESVMKSAEAIDEADVSSGFKDSYPSSEWETEDGPPSDRGLEDKEKDPAEWEKEKPKAAQDYQVKEAIEKGLKENQDLARYVTFLERNHANAISVIKELKRQIQEVNLFNRKMLHVNEMINSFGKKLTKEQKKVVIEKIDSATNVREVKMVAEALKASFGSSLGLHEGAKRRNKPNSQRRLTSGAPDQKVLRESVDNGGRSKYSRIQELAGLVQ